jgi:hypothetical protein
VSTQSESSGLSLVWRTDWDGVSSCRCGAGRWFVKVNKVGTELIKRFYKQNEPVPEFFSDFNVIDGWEGRMRMMMMMMMMMMMWLMMMMKGEVRWYHRPNAPWPD